MDLASIIGFIGACGMIAGAMITGGGLGPFIDTLTFDCRRRDVFCRDVYGSPFPRFWARSERCLRLFCLQ